MNLFSTGVWGMNGYAYCIDCLPPGVRSVGNVMNTTQPGLVCHVCGRPLCEPELIRGGHVDIATRKDEHEHTR